MHILFVLFAIVALIGLALYLNRKQLESNLAAIEPAVPKVEAEIVAEVKAVEDDAVAVVDKVETKL